MVQRPHRPGLDTVFFKSLHKFFPVLAINFFIYLQQIHPVIIVRIVRHAGQGKVINFIQSSLVLACNLPVVL